MFDVCIIKQKTFRNFHQLIMSGTADNSVIQIIRKTR